MWITNYRDKILIRGIFLTFLLMVLCSCSWQGFSNSANPELAEAQRLWKGLSVQHQGRVKPFDTLAREVLRAVYGRDRYKGKSAVELILSWLVIPDFWEDTEIILVEKEIKQSLDLPLKQKHFSPLELRDNPKLGLQLAELTAIKQKGESLDSYFQKLEKLETRLILYSAIRSGFLIRIEPQKEGATWKALKELSDPVEKQFKSLFSKYIQLILSSVQSTAKEANLPSKKKALSQFQEKSALLADVQSNQSLLESFQKEMEQFQTLVLGGKKPPLKIRTEVFYNSFQPFQKAWIFYFLFLAALLGLLVFRRMDWLRWLVPLPALAFAFHSLGMALRSYIMSRPPVSNMFETVVWVPWVAVIAGFVFYLKGLKLPFIASVILAFFCLLLTSLAPEILDASLQPLEAVLRSTFWLSTHVLVITMSYSFFFLAFVLGDMALISYLSRKSEPMSMVKKMYQPIYRSIQWGVVLLAGGTILGGIWADYSWGRFWGWDPKESWALVSLLAYLALLHGKLVGWIQPFGMAVGSVMMFFSVIMAWYGVNFILGAGLHSYGFGSGGVEYVAGFLVLHAILCTLAGFKKIKQDRP